MYFEKPQNNTHKKKSGNQIKLDDIRKFLQKRTSNNRNLRQNLKNKSSDSSNNSKKPRQKFKNPRKKITFFKDLKKKKNNTKFPKNPGRILQKL